VEEKHQEKLFILHNYVISPLIQKNKCEETRNPFDVKVIYLNTRKNVKSTIERMIVNYNSQKKNNKNWCSIIVRIRRKSYKAIHYEGEGDDNFYNEHVRSAI
jgi:hypothetical protein